jgi:adenylate cyclase
MWYARFQRCSWWFLVTDGPDIVDKYSTSEAEAAAMLEVFRRLGGDAADLHGEQDLVLETAVLALRPPGPRVTLHDAAKEAGMSPTFASQVWAGLGFQSADRDISTVEVEMLQALASTVEILGEDGVVELSRVLGLAVRQVAEATVSSVRLGYELPTMTGNVSDTTRAHMAENYHFLVGSALPIIEGVFGASLRRHLATSAKRGWSPDAGSAVAIQEVVVGFADLVGFTNWSAQATEAELAAALDHFDESVWRAAGNTGVQLVKMIGDEVMFAASSAQQALDAARAIAQAAPGLDEAGVRVGISQGRVLARAGDLFGPTVNLAARLVTAAEPGTALVGVIAAGELNSADVGDVQTFDLRGFDDQVEAHIVTL